MYMYHKTNKKQSFHFYFLYIYINHSRVELNYTSVYLNVPNES